VPVSDLSEVSSLLGIGYPHAAVRRLFSTFARGAPGAGLLLIRVVLGTTLVYQAVMALMRGSGLVADLIHSLPGVLGVLLLLGLWTPFAGALVAVESVWQAYAGPSQMWQSLSLGMVGAAIALLGPGAWSIDARLFGWRRIEIPEENSTDTSEPPSS
jgi:putative oxidoreductase